jgi:hypothetical protein
VDQTNEGTSKVTMTVQKQLANDTVRADRRDQAAAQARQALNTEAPGLGTPASRIAQAEMDMAKATAEEKSDPLNDELQAMRSVARTLEKLPRDVQDRVVTWLCNRLPPRIEGLGEMLARR